MTSQLISRRMAAKNLIAAGAAGLAVATLAEGQQPHMQAALRALNNAATQLQAAADDKAGHREKAIQLVSQAINQVQQGIQAGVKK
ncbi:MAG: hypothetical protein ABSH45_05090 [Bryobacteraceae bacterium]|jgi:hypothetical protein